MKDEINENKASIKRAIFEKQLEYEEKKNSLSAKELAILKRSIVELKELYARLEMQSNCKTK